MKEGDVPPAATPLPPLPSPWCAMEALMTVTSQSKSRQYTALQKPARAATACSGESKAYETVYFTWYTLHMSIGSACSGDIIYNLYFILYYMSIGSACSGDSKISTVSPMITTVRFRSIDPTSPTPSSLEVQSNHAVPDSDTRAWSAPSTWSKV